MSPNPSFSNDLYLAIDQGGHASRAIVFNQHGVIISQAFSTIQIARPQPNHVEHDADELLESIRQSVAAVVAKLGDDAKHIVAAGLATQRSNVVCWDKHTGTALGPVISWQDVRAYEDLQKFQPQADTIHKTTGLFLSAHYGASKLQWCMQNNEQVKQAYIESRLCMGPMASFIIYNLLEEKPFVADPTNASRTQLWNIKSKNWDPLLLSLFDIPENVLPVCVPCSHDFGHLNVNNRRIPFTVLIGDQSAAMFAYGKTQAETAYINTGTGAFISRPSGYAMLYSRRLLTSIIFQQNSQAEFVLEGTVNGAGSAIDYVSDQLGEKDVFEHINHWLDQYKDSLQQYFMNGVSGLGAPFWIPDFPIKFTAKSNTEEKFVAVVESIIFLLHESLLEMLKLSSQPEQIQITGGLAQMSGLCQRLADLSGLPVYRPIQCEATARGLAYLLANKPAAWPEARPGDWFKPAKNDSIKNRYKKWHELMLREMRK